jgi:hypothetical protein
MTNKKTTATKILFSLLIISVIFLSHKLKAQEADTTKAVNLEFITDQIENIAQTTDLNLDYSDLVDEYLYYYDHPVDLNSEDNQKLVEIGLLNESQLFNLNKYIDQYGKLYSVYELKYIPGFDIQTLKNMLPFITLNSRQSSGKTNLGKALKYGRHQIIMRYQQVLEQSVGYEIPMDSAIHKPGSAYLGGPQKYYLRYGFNYHNKIRFGFTLDKDAGEVFLKSNLNDSLNALVGNKVTNVFDFYSAHIYVSDMGILKKAVIGDYHLEVGQGLTLWTGLAFGKTSDGVQIKRYGRGLRPNTSANENRFFRGAAVTIGAKGFELTGFFSNNSVDANMLAPDTLTPEDEISTITETGYHRTINELLDKDVLKISAYGGRLSYSHRFFKLGATAFQTKLNIPLTLGDQVYKQFYFQGNELINYGFDLNVNFNKLAFFGEFSGSDNGGMAGLGGINAYLDERFTLTVFYHNFGKDYHNLFANPFAESSSLLNEQGIYAGFRILPLQRVSITGYIDYFKFPWLRYLVDAPSSGRDYLLQVNYNPARHVQMYFRYRDKKKSENYSGDYDYVPLLAEINRKEFRFFVSYQPFPFLIFKNRMDFTTYQKEFEEKENGYMIYQDILYRPNRFPLEVTFRYALFDTDSYDSRIYTYENDLLYSFSVPAYFDKGQRVYLMLKWKIYSRMNMWFRIARTIYSDRVTVGSGSDLINGNHKTEVKVQLQVKL